MGISVPFAGFLSAMPLSPEPQSSGAPLSKAAPLPAEEDQLLNEVENANFRFFWEQANPKTGMVKDRCNVQAADNGTVASLAATGFG